MATERVQIGKGVLSWSRYERIGDRYGTVYLFPGGGDDPLPWPDELPLGQRGTLTATVLETRPSAHIGDLFRGFSPGGAEAGETVTLGTGLLFTETDDGYTGLGVRPEDGRDTDWLDPRALYRCHDQTVSLAFTPEGD